MTQRYDLNLNRRALEARERGRWLGLARTLSLTTFAAGLIILVALYGLLVSARHQDVQRIRREARRVTTGAVKGPVLSRAALENIMDAKGSPRLWATRLRRLSEGIPSDGLLDELEAGTTSRPDGTPGNASVGMAFSGSFPVSSSESSPMRPVTRWIDELQADSTFRHGFQKIELESSRMATGPNERAVEFRIVAR